MAGLNQILVDVIQKCVIVYKYSMHEEHAMRNIMDKLNTAAATNILSEEFVAEVTNPDLQYKTVLETTVDANTTDEEINAAIDAAFNSYWGI